MIRMHPFGIGIGEGAWHAVYPHYAVSGTSRVMHAHNIFLQVATELGVVGLVLFLLIVSIALCRGLQKRKIVAVSALAGVLLMGLFDHLWYYPGMLVPLYATMALCMSRGRKVTKKEHFVDILHEN